MIADSGTPLTRTAAILGYAGLIPFVALPILPMFSWLTAKDATGLFVAYSALILSFLGGVHWYDSQARTAANLQVNLAMLPTLLGWACLTLVPHYWAVLVLLFAFAALLALDYVYLTMSKAYWRLRCQLSAVVIGCHGALFWLLSAAPI